MELQLEPDPGLLFCVTNSEERHPAYQDLSFSRDEKGSAVFKRGKLT